MCHHTFVQTHRTYATKSELYNVNYELWLIMTCQCRFISYKNHATLRGDVDNGGGYVWGQEYMRTLNFLLFSA